MMAAIIQIIDTTIANVALPHMQGSLSATQDQISWVLTSYIITAAIAMPMTGWVAEQYDEQATKGSLEVGKLADLVILDQDPLKVKSMAIKDIKVVETIKEGRTIYPL